MESLPLFVNHYQTKLQINNIFFDVYFVLIFILLILITSKKSLEDRPLSFLQTSQIRGLGITLIILNHICYYTEPPPFLYVIWSEAGMIGVAIFLILSGYGLCISLGTKGIQNFFTNRISKILIPLILALSLLQFLYLTFTPDGGTIPLGLLKILFSMYSLDRKRMSEKPKKMRSLIKIRKTLAKFNLSIAKKTGNESYESIISY